jgi:glycosyltransferase involved in cell wall biosynthesis
VAAVPIKVVIVRGHLATPWELRPWAELPERFDVSFLLTRSNGFDPQGAGLRAQRVRALRDLLPKGLLGEVLTGLAGDRYLDADRALAGADIVHAEELSFWFAADVARRKGAGGYRLVQTVWETIPFLHAYRNRHARRFRDEVLAATDLFLPATERARDALRLEGVAPDRLEVCPPGIDVDRFGAAPDGPPPAEHTILSPGRLVWEKGHQDVLRAVAALHRDLVGTGHRPRVKIVGKGPEEARLREHAQELGIAHAVEFAQVPYDGMPDVFARASCMVLASLPSASAAYHPFDSPRAFWEEQFGLVLAEGMAAGLAIVAADSGAIREVVGDTGTYVQPGGWMQLAHALADGPLSRPVGARTDYPAERIRRYSTTAMAERLAGAYDRVLARR